MPVCEIDLCVGGALRFELPDDDGRSMGLTSVFREIAPNGRTVTTGKFDEDWTDGETLVAQSLNEIDGGTTLRTHILYASQAARDGAKMSGMTDGMEAGYTHLDAVPAEMAA